MIELYKSQRLKTTIYVYFFNNYSLVLYSVLKFAKRKISKEMNKRT